MLSLGDEILFSVYKTFELDNEHFAILKNNSEQFIINTKDYPNYSFSNGEVVKCRVDKINCSGKIYFEPEHPYYKEKNYYNFYFIQEIDRDNLFSIIEVSDKYGNIHQCRTAKHGLIEGQSVKLWLDKISKGLFYLCDQEKSTDFQLLGSIFSATLSMDSYIQWEGKKIFVDKSLYPWLEEDTEQEVFFIIQRFDFLGFPVIELVHKDFFPEKIIKVKLIRQVSFPAGRNDKHQMIECIGDNNMKMYLSKRYLSTWKEGDECLFKVDTVKKGRILLKPIETNVT